LSVVIKGGSRCNRRYFTRHLLNRKENDKVRVVACRGFAREDVAQAFEDMEVMARGTRTKNYFYPFSINPEPGEPLTDEQFDRAEDITLKHLGMEGQPRIVVEHTKKGRTHRHVAVFRIDENGKAISDSLTYRKHEAAAREIEKEFGLKPMESVLVKGRDKPRPLRRGRDWEGYRGSITGLDPLKVRDEVTRLRKDADGPQSFNQAMRQHGYILCQGEKRDYCFVDPAGKVHSLGRRVADIKAAELRRFMAGLDRQTLPTIEDAKKRAEPWGDSQAARTIQEAEAQKRVRKSVYAAARMREKMPEDTGGSDAARLRQVKYEKELQEQAHKAAGDPGHQAPDKSSGDWKQRTADKKDREPER
jgi:hypothetical protein